MNIEKMREEFETALIAMHVESGLPVEDARSFVERGGNGQYTSLGSKGAWWAWQASRASLVIPVIGTATDYPDDSEPGARYWNNARDEQIALIRSEGLKCHEDL